MDTKYKTLCASTIIFLLFISSARAQIGVKVDSTLEGAVNAKIDTKTQIETDTKAKVDLGSDTDVRINSKNEMGTQATTDDDTDPNAKEDSSGKGFVRNSTGVAVTSAIQVKSEEDLQTFRSNVFIKNKAVKSLDIDSQSNQNTKVEVVYKHNGRLFGFIPVVIKSTTVVNAKANSVAEVKSTIPWWSFLVAGENYNGATLESNIKANSKIKTSAKVNASAEAKAEVAEAIITELQTNALLQANAEIK